MTSHHRCTTARSAAGADDSSDVMEAGLEDHQVVAVDEVDEPMFLGDPARPCPGQHVSQWLGFPDAGDRVDLGGNHVQYGGTTRLDGLDLGGGALHVNSGKLSIDGTLASTGAAGLIQTLNAGQFWTDGYAGAQRLTIDVDGGRFANTGAVTGKTLLQASDGQTLLATSGASYTLGTGSTLVVEGSEARIGFDGPGAGTARLTMTDNSTLVFKGDAGGFSTIEEFRSGAWDQAGSPVNSSVTLDGTLRVDLSGYAGGAGSHKLIAADELMGSFDEIKFVGLGGGLDADLVVDYVTDTVWLDLS